MRDASRHRTEVGPGHVLALVASGQARTRSAIAELTGLSRPTVAQRLEALFATGLLRESDDILPSGGRPARALVFDERSALVLCADIGEERTRVAVADLRGAIIDEEVLPVAVDEGPGPVLDRIVAATHGLLDGLGVGRDRIAGVGVGLPAPVDFSSGRTVGWSVMGDWEGYDIRGHLSGALEVSVLVDNDVNLLTLAEYRTFWSAESHLLYVKAGTGIGSGIISDHHLNRGAQGAAGDIGHARLSGYGDPACRCGNRGCLEALVGGWALARDLSHSTGRPPRIHDARDIAQMVRRGDSAAVTRLWDAGRILGEAIAFSTSLLNPSVIVVGGMLASAGDHLLAGVREVVYQRALPLATKQLKIVHSRLDHHGAVTGAALLVIDSVLEPSAVDAALAAGAGDLGSLARWGTAGASSRAATPSPSRVRM
jgi:predicted NBD/HSP70 family sugar kinase